MVDRLFSDPRLAELYDAFCAGRPDFGFYLPLVMSAKSVARCRLRDRRAPALGARSRAHRKALRARSR